MIQSGPCRAMTSSGPQRARPAETASWSPTSSQGGKARSAEPESASNDQRSRRASQRPGPTGARRTGSVPRRFQRREDQRDHRVVDPELSPERHPRQSEQDRQPLRGPAPASDSGPVGSGRRRPASPTGRQRPQVIGENQGDLRRESPGRDPRDCLASPQADRPPPSRPRPPSVIERGHPPPPRPATGRPPKSAEKP